MVHTGVACWPGQTFYLVWHAGPPSTGLRPISPDGEGAGGRPFSLLQPASVLPVVRPQLVQSVTILCQLTLYWHGVSQGRIGFIHRLHLHQAIPGRRLLRYLGRQLVNLWLQLFSPLIRRQFWEVLLNCRDRNGLKNFLVRNEG